MTEREPSFQFAPNETEVVVWDLGVRVFHWALVLLMIATIATVKIGGNAMEDGSDPWDAKQAVKLVYSQSAE